MYTQTDIDTDIDTHRLINRHDSLDTHKLTHRHRDVDTHTHTDHA